MNDPRVATFLGFDESGNAQYRVQPSRLDSFRYYLQSDNMTSEQWVKEFLGRREADEMRKGTAFHQLMERTTPPDGSPVNVQGRSGKWYSYLFDLEGATEAWRSLPPVNERVTEVWGRIELLIPEYGWVQMRGKGDFLHGSDGHDIKTMSRPPAPDRAADSQFSSQWKAYCLMFGLSRFFYDPFVLGKARQSDDKISVKTITPVELIPTPGIADELIYEVFHFMRVVDNQGLLGHLRINRDHNKVRA